MHVWSSGRAPSRRQGRNIRGAPNSFACMHYRLDPIPCGRAPVAILFLACLPIRKNHAQNKQQILSEILVVPCFVFLRFWVLEKAESIGRKHTFTMLAVSFLHCYPPLSTFPSKGKGGAKNIFPITFAPFVPMHISYNVASFLHVNGGRSPRGNPSSCSR